jgi:hypothetical protein
MSYKKIILSNGIHVLVREISNIKLFESEPVIPLVEPQPPEFELEDGRILQNFDHPTYYEAMQIYESKKADSLFLSLLNIAVFVDDSYLENPKWKTYYNILRKQRLFDIPEDEDLCFLNYFAFQADSDKSLLTKHALLTEQRVYNTFKSISIMRNHVNIHEAQIKNSVDTGIQAAPVVIGYEQLVNPLDEFKACREASMSWSNWASCKYSLEEKASAIALFRLDNIIRIHSDDAIQIEAERKSKN